MKPISRVDPSGPATSRVWPLLRFIALFTTAVGGYFLFTVSIQARNPADLESRPLVATIARLNAGAQQYILRPYQTAIAATTAASLQFLGYDATAAGRRVLHEQWTIEITHGCDGVELSLLLTAAILAFPAHAGPKFRGLLLGLCALALCNFVRVLTLWLIGRHWPAVFEFVHFSVWPFLAIGFTLAVFAFWSRFASPAAPAGGTARA